MRHLHCFSFLLALVLCVGCDWKSHLKITDEDHKVFVDRYDRIEALYLMTGDFSALQHMNIDHPMETRTLIEDVLKIGHVNDREINTRFLRFFQDSTLQTILNEVSRQYADMDDINKELAKAFKRLEDEVPGLRVPYIYAQIGALDQSVVIANNMVGICLDKYLGTDFSPYKAYYPLEQRRLMVRSMIIPDCLHFFILSQFPLPAHDKETQLECDVHMAKIQWVVNRLIGRDAFCSVYVEMVDKYMKHHKKTTMLQLLSQPNLADIIMS